jgi:molybdenum cofactor cytidylyltransferase
VKFGNVPVSQAAGAILAHTQRVRGAGVFKKGRRLSAADAAALAVAGISEVIAATLDEGDAPEDAAAGQVATAATGVGIRTEEPSTGRCNLRAREHGLLQVDRARIDRLNQVDESITLACLDPFAVVDPGTMVGTVKVIPLAVAAEAIQACVAICSESSPLLRVAPFRPRRAGLVLTELPGTNPTALDRASRSQRIRLERLGSRVTREIRCPHAEAAVAAAIRELAGEGCSPILVLGASAIIDRQDVIPAAVVRAGGAIERLGMPVDPGNLLLLGRLEETPVVGVPGCARSLKPSGFDWVLQRLAVGLPIQAADFTRMGVGGLLAETPGRPQPRAGGDPATEMRASRVAAVVLAAGRSRRMGGENKLLAGIEDVPMVARVVDTVLASSAHPVVVVTGHEGARVRDALAGRAVTFADNPAYEAGMSSSLRAGLDAVQDKVDGVLVCLGDMPWVRIDHLEALIATFDPSGDRPICVPVYDRKRGNPVLWPKKYFREMCGIQGDQGARILLDRHADEVTYVPVPDEGVNLDVDTPAALEALRPGRDGADGPHDA